MITRLNAILLNANLLLLASMAVVSLLAACQIQTSASTEAPFVPTQTPSSPPAAVSTVPPSPAETPVQAAASDPAEIRTAVLAALQALESETYRMQNTIVLSSGQTHINIIEKIPPDRMHVIADNAEYIIVEDKVFLKTEENGQWSEPQIPAATFLESGGLSEKQTAETIGDVQWLRNDLLDGRPVVVYSYTCSTVAGDTEMHTQNEIWIGAEDGLPYKLVIDGETLSVSTDPETGAGQTQAVNAQTTTLIEYDRSISIELP